MNFFKVLLASLLGTFIALFLLLLIFVGLISAAVSGSSEKEVAVVDNSILHIELDNLIVERGQESEFKFNPSSFESEEKTGLNHFIKDLQRAKTDDKIKGIYLEVGNFMGQPSSLKDMRDALLDFKTSGKWIMAYSEGYSQAGYYMASAANEVYLYPAGEIDWRGINAERVFFKKMLDNLGIEAQVLRGPNNKYKSAVEPFIYDHMSDESKSQTATYISDIWRVMLDEIAASRNVSTADLNLLADSLSLFDVQKAVDSKLIDGVLYEDQVMTNLKNKIGIADAQNTKSDKDLKFLSMNDYHKSGSGKNKDGKSDFSKDKIAVVYAVGEIQSGEGSDDIIGSVRIAEALKNAREDEKVKAIILRVNSPGGSALASDVIWRETQLIKQSGKPFYVSMGDFAASGGYYISCAADRIFANPNTITGSIGVFGIIPNLQKFWEEKIGVTFDQYETNPHADLMTTNKPLDEKQMQTLEKYIAKVYYDFISKVAEGRHKSSTEEVDGMGQGRVWSGEDALGLGLVDEMGGLQKCIGAIAQKAGMTDYAIKELPEMIDPFEKLLENLTGQKKAAVMQEVLGEQYSLYKNLQTILEMKGVQARLPYSIEIK
jgi:protease IV